MRPLIIDSFAGGGATRFCSSTRLAEPYRGPAFGRHLHREGSAGHGPVLSHAQAAYSALALDCAEAWRALVKARAQPTTQKRQTTLRIAGTRDFPPRYNINNLVEYIVPLTANPIKTSLTGCCSLSHGKSPDNSWVRVRYIGPVFMALAGMKAAGRLLDAFEHNGMPLSPSSNPIPHGKRDGGGL